MKAEIDRRESNRARLQAFFEAHPLVWIQPKDGLEEAGGRYAWRSRLPQVRKRIAGVVEWNGVNGSGTAYRFLPFRPLGRSAEVARNQLGLW